jgi:hypothetical protein
MKKSLLSCLFALLTLMSFPASAQDVEMSDALVANGKIYIVVAVLLILLIGLFIYLISLDRRMRKLENAMPSTDKEQRNA